MQTRAVACFLKATQGTNRHVCVDLTLAAQLHTRPVRCTFREKTTEGDRGQRRGNGETALLG